METKNENDKLQQNCSFANLYRSIQALRKEITWARFTHDFT